MFDLQGHDRAFIGLHDPQINHVRDEILRLIPCGSAIRIVTPPQSGAGSAQLHEAIAALAEDTVGSAAFAGRVKALPRHGASRHFRHILIRPIMNARGEQAPRATIERIPSQFDRWIGGRRIESIGTNAGAAELPFQSWRRFKEAFAPEVVAEAVRSSAIPVRRCVDPFGGSGTTALACQFLGVHPITAEVNPFLADLIEAKLATYDTAALTRDFAAVVKRSLRTDADVAELLQSAPQTFVEPGVDGRWIFDAGVAKRIAAILDAVDRLRTESHRRFFRVILAGILIDVSNVTVSGKGRRYRRRVGRTDSQRVDRYFRDAVRRAITDVHEFSIRPNTTYDLIRGDSREFLSSAGSFDLAVFSPPYPNSFDYTDVYNVELWTLGYLRSSQMNQALRRATISSHVQISRDFAPPPDGSPTLDRAMQRLHRSRSELWSPWIPAMVGAYFADLCTILRNLAAGLTRRGAVWMIVGDSRYAGIHIPTAAILGELAPRLKFRVSAVTPFRSMRSSAQQGGSRQLAESLVICTRR